MRRRTPAASHRAAGLVLEGPRRDHLLAVGLCRSDFRRHRAVGRLPVGVRDDHHVIRPASRVPVSTIEPVCRVVVRPETVQSALLLRSARVTSAGTGGSGVALILACPPASRVRSRRRKSVRPVGACARLWGS